MRYKILAPLLACMLLCSCDGGEDTSSKHEPVTTAASTVSTSDETQTNLTTEKATATKAAAKTTAAKTTVPVTETKASDKAAETSAQSQNSTESSYANKDEDVVDFVEEIDVDAQITTSAATEAKTTYNGDGDMPDDGMVWTPLVPVD